MRSVSETCDNTEIPECTKGGCPKGRVRLSRTLSFAHDFALGVSYDVRVASPPRAPRARPARQVQPGGPFLLNGGPGKLCALGCAFEMAVIGCSRGRACMPSTSPLYSKQTDLAMVAGHSAWQWTMPLE